jgi:hypothetical protein
MVDRYVVVETVYGRTEAEFLRSYLQARGVHCEISQEAAGSIFPATVGVLARVDILVPSRQGKAARQALKEYHKAKRIKE